MEISKGGRDHIFPLPRNAFPREGTGGKTKRVDSAGKLDSPSDRRPRKGKLSQGKENGLIVRFPSRGNAFLAGGCIFFLERASLNVS